MAACTSLYRYDACQCVENEKMRLRGKTNNKEDINLNTSCEEQQVLEVKFIDCYKGHGVFTKSTIRKGQLICYYAGELITKVEGEERLASEKSVGSFLFFFKFKGKQLCTDATFSSGIGRMINDDHRRPNSKVVVEDKDGRPTLCIYSIKPILIGEEICFDYKDSSVPWRKRDATRYALYPNPGILLFQRFVLQKTNRAAEL